MKKVILALVLTVLLVPAAMADGVHFGIEFINWSWAGGATPLTGNDNATPVVIATGTVGVNTGAAIVGPASFSTGNYISGSGTLADPFKFGAGAANSFVINGCGGPCFTGNIQSFTLAHDAAGNFLFTADLIIGNVSAALFGAMGLPVPGNLIGWQGSLSGTLDGTATVNGGRGTDGSIDMGVAPVPEPGTLALFGSGLIGIAGMIRRKIMSL